jgi:hypothetical protein
MKPDVDGGFLFFLFRVSDLMVKRFAIAPHCYQSQHSKYVKLIRGWSKKSFHAPPALPGADPERADDLHLVDAPNRS